MLSSLAHSILHSAPVPILVVNSSGSVYGANRQATRLFGGTVATGADAPLADILPGFPLDIWGASQVSDEHPETPIATRWTLMSTDGRALPVDVQPARFREGDNTILALFLNDASPAVAAEAKIQELRLRIAHNWRLNSLGEMASLLAHELNQPLAAIANGLHNALSLLASDAPDPVRARDHLETVVAQTQRAGATIRRMRNLTAQDSGSHAELNMAEVVGEVLPLLELSAREAKATIETDVDPQQTTRGDRVQVQQLIANLVRNALDAPRTDRRRRIRITGGADPDGGYRVTVEDNGPGIREDLKTALFEPLVSSKPGGMGLGLSICRTLVRAHGGRIWCGASRLGGAAFAFTLNAPRTPTA